MELSSVSIALECGGSDVSSSICANPIIGNITDFVIENGGSAIVSETAEFIGAEKFLQIGVQTSKLGSRSSIYKLSFEIDK